jgi:hypothetical protein
LPFLRLSIHSSQLGEWKGEAKTNREIMAQTEPSYFLIFQSLDPARQLPKSSVAMAELALLITSESKYLSRLADSCSKVI